MGKCCRSVSPIAQCHRMQFAFTPQYYKRISRFHQLSGMYCRPGSVLGPGSETNQQHSPCPQGAHCLVNRQTPGQHTGTSPGAKGPGRKRLGKVLCELTGRGRPQRHLRGRGESTVCSSRNSLDSLLELRGVWGLSTDSGTVWCRKERYA